MKYLAVILLAVATVALALPTEYELPAGVIPILKREEVRDEHGQYSLSYVTGDGTHVTEEGSLREGPEGHVLIKKGTVMYTSPEGQTFSWSYSADENGYHAEGDHFPH